MKPERPLAVLSQEMTEIIISAATQIFLKELYEALAKEDYSFLGFKGQLQEMECNLRFINSIRNDLQMLESNHPNYDTLRPIMDHLRDLVYDGNDAVVKCRTRASYEKVVWHRGYTINGLKFRLCMKNALEQINTGVKDMRNKLGCLTPTSQMFQTSNYVAYRRARSTPHASSKFRPVGLKQDTEKLIELLKTRAKSHQIGIVGMAGSGKTTIAHVIFRHDDVQSYFDELIWVTVSQTFSEDAILADLVNQLHDSSGVCPNDNMCRLQRSLDNKKYLIVLDDVWDERSDWWTNICERLPEGGICNKCILITTRNERAARNMGATYIHNVRKLNSEESWSLFSEVAFSADKRRICDSGYKEVGKAIMQKCEGLPLAIKTMAGLLSTKITSLHQWKMVKENFHPEMQRSSVLTSLKMSYDDLPPTLKRCILCFSIYPEDCVIDTEQLVYWWVSEGFVHGNEQKTAIEVGFENVLELVSRCLIEVEKQRNFDGKVYKCKMHDMVRELIIQISKGEKFSSFDVENRQIPDSDTRHLGYLSGMDEDLLENNTKLCAFLLMNSSFTLNQSTALARVRSLQVLDLAGNEADTVNVKNLLSWIKSQKQLAYLNLRKVRGLEQLPGWIWKRQNLQVLVITECNELKQLHRSITALQNLVVLDVDACPVLNLPWGLGRLTKLQILSGFKIRKGRHGTRFSDLKGLKELRFLGIKLSKHDEITEDVHILSELRHLKILSIDTKGCEQDHISLVNKLTPPESLQELFLRSYCGNTMPDWVRPSSLPDLSYLYIDGSLITSVGTNFWGNDETSWKIEGLFFQQLPNFVLDPAILSSKMTYLRYMEVNDCAGLNSSFNKVEYSWIWENEGDGSINEEPCQ